MVTVDDAARIALELPRVTEGERYGNRSWSVDGKAFAWDRPLSKADIRRFGDGAVPEWGDMTRPPPAVVVRRWS